MTQVEFRQGVTVLPGKVRLSAGYRLGWPTPAPPDSTRRGGTNDGWQRCYVTGYLLINSPRLWPGRPFVRRVGDNVADKIRVALQPVDIRLHFIRRTGGQGWQASPAAAAFAGWWPRGQGMAGPPLPDINEGGTSMPTRAWRRGSQAAFSPASFFLVSRSGQGSRGALNRGSTRVLRTGRQ